MRVLIVHNAYKSHQVGGEDVVVQKELLALKKALGEANVFEYLVSNDDVRPVDLVTTLWGNQRHFKGVAQVVKQHKIDIVHIHNFFPLLTPTVFAGAKYAGAKVVHTLHNFRWWCSAGTFYRNNAVCEQCLHKNFGWPGVLHQCYRNSTIQSLAATMAFGWYRLKDYAKHIDAYFVLTRFQQEKLRSKISDTKMLLKPNGIDEPHLTYPIDDKKDYLFVGRLESAKGIEHLLSEWAQFPSNMILKVIGSGEQELMLKKAYQQDNIQFLGKMPHDEVMQEMAKAKYFIHSSLAYESFGLTLVEALSVGTPVIAIDIGPRAEFIQSGKNGFLCQAQQLAQTILQSQQLEDYASMSFQASESAKPFYIEHIIGQQINYYHQIMEGKSNA